MQFSEKMVGVWERLREALEGAPSLQSRGVGRAPLQLRRQRSREGGAGRPGHPGWAPSSWGDPAEGSSNSWKSELRPILESPFPALLGITHVVVLVGLRRGWLR